MILQPVCENRVDNKGNKSRTGELKFAFTLPVQDQPKLVYIWSSSAPMILACHLINIAHHRQLNAEIFQLMGQTAIVKYSS